MLKRRKQRKLSRLERFCGEVVIWVGSVSSLVVHTFAFIFIFCLPLFGVSFNRMLLILTTGVSLEAIYLAIFMQMTLNRHSESLEEVELDVMQIQDEIKN